MEEPQAPPPPPPKEELHDDRGLEELLRFINGDEKDGKGGASSKAAKRARQKQKKVWPRFEFTGFSNVVLTVTVHIGSTEQGSAGGFL